MKSSDAMEVSAFLDLDLVVGGAGRPAYFLTGFRRGCNFCFFRADDPVCSISSGNGMPGRICDFQGGITFWAVGSSYAGHLFQ